MLSDIKDISNLLKTISFKAENSEPLQPFEQLMANLPPSSAELLPSPYQWLMKSSKSPIKDFYPESFTIDMNGKRWPWEAVVLLPFIDSDRLVKASRTFVSKDMLSSDELDRNQEKGALVYARDEKSREDVPGLGNAALFNRMVDCNIREELYDNSKWRDVKSEKNAVFSPELLPGTVVPYPGFPSLKDAPVQALKRRKLGINVFGMRSRYRTAILKMNSEIPMIASAATLAEKFIGTTLHFRYPFLQEGFVTAVSDSKMTVRGKETPRQWTDKEVQAWKLKNDTVRSQYINGEGLTGSGGWEIPESGVTLSVRPLKEIQTLSDGREAKIYARLEVEVPFIAALWSPSQPDPRFSSIPARLERNPYRFGSEPILSIGIKNGTKSNVNSKINTFESTLKSRRSTEMSRNNVSRKNVLPPLPKRVGGTKGFCTIPYQSSQLSNKVHSTKLPLKQRSFGLVAVVIAGLVSKTVGSGLNSLLPTKVFNNDVPTLAVRGGNRIVPHQDQKNSYDDSSTPPLEFSHGTTTLSFTFDDGIIVAVDSRASIGNFVGSKTTQKVLPITNHILVSVLI